MTKTWPASFETILRRYVPLLPTDQALFGDLVPADHGLDSMAAVSLFMDLEEHFGVELPDLTLNGLSQADVATMWRAFEAEPSEGKNR